MTGYCLFNAAEAAPMPKLAPSNGPGFFPHSGLLAKRWWCASPQRQASHRAAQKRNPDKQQSAPRNGIAITAECVRQNKTILYTPGGWASSDQRASWKPTSRRLLD
jgi:hypothetical protein